MTANDPSRQQEAANHGALNSLGQSNCEQALVAQMPVDTPTRETVSMTRRSAKAERILAVADNATRMRAGLQSKNTRAHRGLTVVLIIVRSRAPRNHRSFISSSSIMVSGTWTALGGSDAGSGAVPLSGCCLTGRSA